MNPASGPVLRDIHLPPPPGWWPLAPGWWVLAVICILCAVATVIKLRKVYLCRRRRRAVLDELDRSIEGAHGDPAALAAALSRFLRRMTLDESAAAAAYTGQRWLDHLDAGSDCREFSQGIGRVLIEAPFRPVPQHYDSAALIALVRRWTRHTLAAGSTHA
jgi:hypothetical protein